MDLSRAIQHLEDAWSEENGVLFRLRMGYFDAVSGDDLLQMLRGINVDEDEHLPRRAVSLLWYMPGFVRWQRERVEPQDRTKLDRLETLITNELERILGVP